MVGFNTKDSITLAEASCKGIWLGFKNNKGQEEKCDFAWNNEEAWKNSLWMANIAELIVVLQQCAL